MDDVQPILVADADVDVTVESTFQGGRMTNLIGLNCYSSFPRFVRGDSTQSHHTRTIDLSV